MAKNLRKDSSLRTLYAVFYVKVRLGMVKKPRN